jgi:hypothetical protein
VQQWNKEPRCETADTAREGDDILHGLQEIHEAANGKARNQVYEWATENE